jgi:hypothetical protein
MMTLLKITEIHPINTPGVLWDVSHVERVILQFKWKRLAQPHTHRFADRVSGNPTKPVPPERGRLLGRPGQHRSLPLRQEAQFLCLWHVSRLCRTHQEPIGILAGTSALARCATSRARREGFVYWHRAFDAAALGTIQAMDKANSASFMHDRPEHTHRSSQYDLFPPRQQPLLLPVLLQQITESLFGQLVQIFLLVHRQVLYLSHEMRVQTEAILFTLLWRSRTCHRFAGL